MHVFHRVNVTHVTPRRLRSPARRLRVTRGISATGYKLQRLSRYPLQHPPSCFSATCAVRRRSVSSRVPVEVYIFQSIKATKNTAVEKDPFRNANSIQKFESIKFRINNFMFISFRGYVINNGSPCIFITANQLFQLRVNWMINYSL